MLMMLRLCLLLLLLLLAKRFPNERCHWLSLLTRRCWPGIEVAASSSDDERQCETDGLNEVISLLLVPVGHIFIVHGHYDVTALQMPVRWTSVEDPLY